ncbi:YqcC family protein [Shewanella benthica]|uniref:YqcC family protein n=1 Tax=Shewanella benthica TaxID=43661 RepID=UPI0018792197|nr:YqcC family protein [Shewanella benthica]MBE7215132.1 YqcC family protein [Shewanella benthica]MCL1062172.1 YqcC family protein [Shewanella benthica]
MLYIKTTQKLQELEEELKRRSLWSLEVPSAEAMADTSPFSCEAMSFESWVQFIFIPKMRALIASRQVLPNNIAIAPMAHHVWNDVKERHTLIMIFDDLDKFLSEPR